MLAALRRSTDCHAADNSQRMSSAGLQRTAVKALQHHLQRCVFVHLDRGVLRRARPSRPVAAGRTTYARRAGHLYSLGHSQKLPTVNTQLTSERFGLRRHLGIPRVFEWLSISVKRLAASETIKGIVATRFRTAHVPPRTIKMLTAVFDSSDDEDAPQPCQAPVPTKQARDTISKSAPTAALCAELSKLCIEYDHTGQNLHLYVRQGDKSLVFTPNLSTCRCSGT